MKSVCLFQISLYEYWEYKGNITPVPDPANRGGGFGDVLAEFLFLNPGTLQAFFHLMCYLKSGGLSIKTC